MRTEDVGVHVADRYRGEKGKVYHLKHDVPQAAHRWIARSRAKKLTPHINPSDVVLEYGVGPGWNIDAIACKRRLGYDLSTFLEDRLSSKGITFVADTIDLPDASIDTIICHHVLEHTSNPVQILVEIKRLLCEGGKLLIFVPYEKEGRYRSYYPDEPNHHLFSWNVQTLGNLVHDVGFRVLYSGLERYGYDRFLSVWAWRLKVGGFGFRLAKKLALSIIPLLEVKIVAIKS